MGYAFLDALDAETGGRADNRTFTCLIGRHVTFRYIGGDYRLYTGGTIAEHLGGMRFGVKVDGYTANGRAVTVDMHRGEFQLPRAAA